MAHTSATGPQLHLSIGLDELNLEHLGKTVQWFKRHPDCFFMLHTTLWSNPIYVTLLAEINPHILRFVHPKLRRHPIIVEHAFRSCPELHDVVFARARSLDGKLGADAVLSVHQPS